MSASLSYSQLTQLDHGWTKELIEVLSILVSAQNPDGSNWLPNSTGIPVYIASTNAATTVNVLLEGVDPSTPVAQLASIDTKGNQMVAQGIPESAPTAGSAWWFKITDGTNNVGVTTGGALKVDGSAVTQPVSGTVGVSNFPATQQVAGSVTTTPASGSQQHVIIDQENPLGLILMELRRISILLTILVGVEVSDADVPTENYLS